ncbi:PREDICTED: solute carrier family 2, facilitated glucose transporter member 1-like [Amphimedon queenslandica]|uniref:Major facilitator superfamily (MFS) profile domain-containing protein n=1 Tax=Amphimedon queenslandica TaxID=400682 RepID=A0A1X7VQN1_AMPQE|nr:PREDICTED: solute carrier family 2, facilitated glucose transporter member 1-like [Amphimedon queenslandica]|eukprot:XP_003383220.1 PREDICTED: solute carrier family 2, facilitated glucose transporter member 1-like [Amphimedon queenslandica]
MAEVDTKILEEGPRMITLNNNKETIHSISGNRITPVLVLCVIATTIGSSAQFGFNTGVINNIQEPIRTALNGSMNNTMDKSHGFTNLEWAATVSIFAIGGMFGALPAGAMADCIGRKWSMMANNVVAIAGVLLQSLAVSPYMLIAGRFVIGINAGINTVIGPLYVSEISPIKYRGAMGTFVQLSITSTILLSQIFGINAIVGTGQYGWRILLAVPLLFVIVQVLILPWCPESPRFLYIRRRKCEAAEKALKRLCGSGSVLREMREMEVELEERNQNQRANSLVITDFITNPVLRRALAISIMLHLSQQITGIGSLLYYSSQIFKDAGVSDGDVATSVMGVVLVLGTIATIILIDRVGRRTLMLYGLGGMAIFFALVSTAFCFQFAFYSDDETKATAPGVLLVVFAFGVTFSFALGPGAIPWLMVSELFKQEARPFAVSIATIVNWLSNFAISFAFPFMLNHLKPYPFIIFMGISALIWLFMYCYLVETKGKSIEQIIASLKAATSGTSSHFIWFYLRKRDQQPRPTATPSHFT